VQRYWLNVVMNIRVVQNKNIEFLPYRKHINPLPVNVVNMVK
jgi:hypothetical protein